MYLNVLTGTISRADLFEQIKINRALLRSFADSTTIRSLSLSDDKGLVYLAKQCRAMERLAKRLEKNKLRLDDCTSSKLDILLSPKKRIKMASLRKAGRCIAKNYLFKLNHVMSFIMAMFDSLVEDVINQAVGVTPSDARFAAAWELLGLMDDSPMKDYYTAMIARAKLKSLTLSGAAVTDAVLAELREKETVHFERLVLGEEYSRLFQPMREYCLAIMIEDVAKTDYLVDTDCVGRAELASQKKLQPLIERGLLQAICRYYTRVCRHDPIINLENKEHLQVMFRAASRGHVGCERFVAKMLMLRLTNFSRLDESFDNTYARQLIKYDKYAVSNLLNNVLLAYKDSGINRLFSQLTIQCQTLLADILDNTDACWRLAMVIQHPELEPGLVSQLLHADTVKLPATMRHLDFSMEAGSKATVLEMISGLFAQQHIHRTSIVNYILKHVDLNERSALYVYFNYLAKLGTLTNPGNPYWMKKQVSKDDQKRFAVHTTTVNMQSLHALS